MGNFSSVEEGNHVVIRQDVHSKKENWINNKKYSFFTFLPLFLYEQFSRFMNAYFLLLAILQRPQIAPVDPLTIWIPLITVLFVAALKEIFDDLGRAKRDKMFNNRKYSMIEGGKATNRNSMNNLKEIRSGEIREGNLIVIFKDQVVPCDVVLLKSSDQNSVVTIYYEKRRKLIIYSQNV